MTLLNRNPWESGNAREADIGHPMCKLCGSELGDHRAGLYEVNNAGKIVYLDDPNAWECRNKTYQWFTPSE